MFPGERAARSAARKFRARTPGIFAATDAIIPRKGSAWGGPMNGQKGRQDLVSVLLELRRPTAIVETGTYFGETTKYLSSIGNVDVWSCESQSAYYLRARARFRHNSAIHLTRSDSRDFLQALAGNVNFSHERIFFYLDAHWSKDLPLREELDIILHTWRTAWVLIDDFQVPDDPGYGYDDYGPQARLTLDYLRIPEGWVPFFPVIPSSAETGARRGCVLVAPSNHSGILLDTGLVRLGTE